MADLEAVKKKLAMVKIFPPASCRLEKEAKKEGVKELRND